MTTDPLREDFEQLVALPDQPSRLTYLSAHPHLVSRATVGMLNAAVNTYVRKDLRKANELAEFALTLADRLGDKESHAYALRARANALWYVGENRQAADLHAKAVQLFEEARQPIEAARTLSSSIQPLILLGEYDRALAAANRARDIYASAGDLARLARLEINVGNIFHRQDRFQEALDRYERAYEQLLPDGDTEGVLAALHNIAMCLISLNDFEKALRAHERVREICKAQNLPLAVIQADYNIAYLYYLRGEYGTAIKLLRATHEACQGTGDPYHAALCGLDLSEIYVELNLSEEAAEMADEAVRRFQDLGMGYEAAKALCNSAIAASQQGKGRQALELFAQARSLFVKEQNPVWPSMVDLYQALVHFNAGRVLEARRLCLAARERFLASPLPPRAILCSVLLARISLTTGEIEDARLNCEDALRQFTGWESPILAYQAHLVMGEIEEAAKRVEDAERHYLAAKDVLETLRGCLHGEELKISFMSNRFAVYENLVNLCVTRAGPRDMDEAWKYMEQAKSRSLLEGMSRRGATFEDAPEGETELVQRVRDLREELNWYYRRIEIEELGRVRALDTRLLELQGLAEQREKKLLHVLRELPPAEAQAVGLDAPSPVSLDALCRTLGAHTTLIEYFRVGERFLAAVVTSTGLTITPVGLTARVADILQMLQFQLSKFRLDESYIREFEAPLLDAARAHLRELYEELIAPLRSQLSGRHLIVVPHELLHYVPFHALCDGEQYLCDLFTVSYAPSASIYVQCHDKQTDCAGPSLVLGVPDASTPSIHDELKSIAAVIPDAELFLGADASSKVLRQRGPRSRMIHIAAHGFFRRDNPMFSGIRLADTLLTVHDLYGLKLAADHVTLSGCSTGLSVIAGGDELIGLMRGLLSAGARTLLLTLWDVHDGSTAQFMKEFYSRIYDGADRSAALREAMLEIRKKYPHPYYWAPFVLVGKTFHPSAPSTQPRTASRSV